ncbi:MAG: hypothetical protein H0V82_01780 [Candidatus Protochlamydia sp.]|nr:hypothetical protein [Candidatus Protochlamydia sp.]
MLNFSALNDEIKNFKFGNDNGNQADTIPNEFYKNQTDELKNKILNVEIEMELLANEPKLFDKKRSWVVKKEEELYEEMLYLHSRLDDLTLNLTENKVVTRNDHSHTSFITETALKIIHPATIFYNSHQLSKKSCFLNQEQKNVKYNFIPNSQGETVHISYYEKIGEAKRTFFYTEDNTQLDGCFIYSDPQRHNLREKKLLVMSHGNYMSWQTAFDHAHSFAIKHNINVLIYNPKGVGSLGKTINTQSSVMDCRAAILYALKTFSNEKTGVIDFNNVGVYGHSIGGGFTAEAIKSLILDKKIPEGALGLYINHHSFSSLADVAYELNPSLYLLAKSYFYLADFNDLPTAQTLNNHKLAKQVIIAAGLKDELIKSSKVSNAIIKLVNTNNIVFVDIQNFGHNNEKSYFLNSNQLNEHDQNELVKYHETIQKWA